MARFDKEHLKQLARERSDKNYARRAVRNAVKYGSLLKEPCFCGEVKVEAHHADYSKPLEVVWCCKKHHIELDRIKRNKDLEAITGIIID